VLILVLSSTDQRDAIVRSFDEGLQQLCILRTTVLAAMGSVVLPHLKTGWHVDQAIMSEEDRLVAIRFGRDWDPDCMRQDEVLYREY